MRIIKLKAFKAYHWVQKYKGNYRNDSTSHNN